MSGILLPAKCCCGKEFTCNSPGFGGCTGCNCIRSRSFLICIVGATGVQSVINNNNPGWTVFDEVADAGFYTFENSNVRIELTLTTPWIPMFPEWPDEPDVNQIGSWLPPGRTWSLVVYYKDGLGNWAEALASKGTDYQWPNGPRWLSQNGCAATFIKNGIRVDIRPKQRWFPTRIRVAISGFVKCGGGSCISTTNPSGLQVINMPFGAVVHEANMDGIFETELDSPWTDTGGNYCYYKSIVVGNYSYDLYPSRSCTGTFWRYSGQYTLRIRMESNGNWSVWSNQESVGSMLSQDVYISSRPGVGGRGDDINNTDFPQKRCRGLLAENMASETVNTVNTCMFLSDYDDYSDYGISIFDGWRGKYRYTAGHGAKITLTALD